MLGSEGVIMGSRAACGGALGLSLILILTSGGVSQASPRPSLKFRSCAELGERFPHGVAKSVKSAREATSRGFHRPTVAKKVFKRHRKSLGPVQFGSLCLQERREAAPTQDEPLQINHPVADLTAIWGVQPFVEPSNGAGLQRHNGLDYFLKAPAVPIVASSDGRLMMAEVFIRPQDGNGQLNIAWILPTGEVSSYSLEPSAGPADAAKAAEQVTLARRMLDELTVSIGDTIQSGQRLTTLYAQDDWAHVHWSIKTSNGMPEEFVCPATYMSAKSQQELKPLVAAWETRIHKGQKDPDLCQ